MLERKPANVRPYTAREKNYCKAVIIQPEAKISARAPK